VSVGDPQVSFVRRPSETAVTIPGAADSIAEGSVQKADELPHYIPLGGSPHVIGATTDRPGRAISVGQAIGAVGCAVVLFGLEFTVLTTKGHLSNGHLSVVLGIAVVAGLLAGFHFPNRDHGSLTTGHLIWAAPVVLAIVIAAVVGWPDKTKAAVLRPSTPVASTSSTPSSVPGAAAPTKVVDATTTATTLPSATPSRPQANPGHPGPETTTLTETTIAGVSVASPPLARPGQNTSTVASAPATTTRVTGPATTVLPVSTAAATTIAPTVTVATTTTTTATVAPTTPPAIVVDPPGVPLGFHIVGTGSSYVELAWVPGPGVEISQYELSVNSSAFVSVGNVQLYRHNGVNWVMNNTFDLRAVNAGGRGPATRITGSSLLYGMMFQVRFGAQPYPLNGDYLQCPSGATSIGGAGGTLAIDRVIPSQAGWTIATAQDGRYGTHSNKMASS
jgi:hypothetical protein